MINNFHSGNRWKAPTKSIIWMIYYHREMVEPETHINNVEKYERCITIKD